MICACGSHHISYKCFKHFIGKDRHIVLRPIATWYIINSKAFFNGRLRIREKVSLGGRYTPHRMFFNMGTVQ